MMNLSEDQLNELASADFDGELALVAADFGLSESDARAALETWPKRSATLVSFESISTLMRIPQERSEFETKQMIVAALPERSYRVLRFTAAAAAVAAVTVASYALWNAGNAAPSTQFASRAADKAASAGVESSGAAADSQRMQKNTAEAPDTAFSRAASATGAPVDLGTVANDAEFAQRLRDQAAASDASSTSISGTATVVPEASTSSTSAPNPDEAPAAGSASACRIYATATLDGQQISVIDGATSWNVVDPTTCSVLRSIPKTPAP